MASSREIINDMRAQAAALDGCHVSGSMMDGVCRSLRRGADEIERLLDDLVWLRGYADIPQEEDAA